MVNEDLNHADDLGLILPNEFSRVAKYVELVRGQLDFRYARVHFEVLKGLCFLLEEPEDERTRAGKFVLITTARAGFRSQLLA